jgi:hypothetical protein
VRQGSPRCTHDDTGSPGRRLVQPIRPQTTPSQSTPGTGHRYPRALEVLASLWTASVEPLNCIEAAARFLASDPAAAGRLLTTHRRRGDGRCTACGMRGGQWPCGPASSALRAVEMGDEERTSTAPNRGNTGCTL